MEYYAPPEQPWMQVLEAFYEGDIVVEVSYEIELHRDSPVLTKTDLDAEQVKDEIRYLLDEDLITWRSHYEHTEFKSHRLTEKGFAVVSEYKQTQRQFRWQKIQQEIAERNGRLESLLIMLTGGLLLASVSTGLVSILSPGSEDATLAATGVFGWSIVDIQLVLGMLTVLSVLGVGAILYGIYVYQTSGPEL